jgi:hypothetical protein
MFALQSKAILNSGKKIAAIGIKWLEMGSEMNEFWVVLQSYGRLLQLVLRFRYQMAG